MSTHKVVNYSEWSKEDLIGRVKELEGIVQTATPNSRSHKTINQECKCIPPTTKAKLRKKAAPRPFDFKAHPLRPIALRLSYLGWSYHGLASQETDTVPTVESHVFNALMTAKLIPDRKVCQFSRCGRTDKGVSAFEQVLGLWIRSSLGASTAGLVKGWENAEQAKKGLIKDLGYCDVVDGEMDYVGILNRILPKDIRVLGWSPVPPTFDARFDCQYRRYKYLFPAGALDIREMRTTASQYTGVHDFRNFCKVDPAKNISSYERRVLDADVRPLGLEDDPNWADGPNGDGLDSGTGQALEADKFYVFTVTGHAFLWHQVRCMMAILFLVGLRKEPSNLPTTLMDLSAHPPNSGRPAYDMASEIPLVLVECGYDADMFRWHRDDAESMKLAHGLRELWRDYAVRSVQIGRLIQGVVGMDERRLSWGSGKEKYVPVMKLGRCDSVEERIRKSDDAKTRKRGAGTPDKVNDAGKRPKMVE
ncbi:hypothetical protein SpCBS45565_g04950 [Spizellomyces sp. 'palustris']|nr:hypothetical protein SpCBS45565_g04950 [Spizellomyces sp. 'palustris']